MFIKGTVNLTAQGLCCLFPPFALQIGCGTFLQSYSGLPLSRICGIMFADIFIYSFLGWYFVQVWPSRYGIAQPVYFPFLPAYWAPGTSSTPVSSDLEGQAAVRQTLRLEEVDEAVYGAPSVLLEGVQKTIRGQRVLSEVTLQCYANQIFTLVGKNGSGKVRQIYLWKREGISLPFPSSFLRFSFL